MNRIRIREAVIVEGKYDKIRLESVIDALIITTDGFGIFKAKDKQKLLRSLARERGLLILTDSDGAGFVIRSFISGCVDPSCVKHAYIPQLSGKERRKTRPSKEGIVGVEGMPREVLLSALRAAGVEAYETESGQSPPGETITRERLYDDGFIGKPDSAKKREALLDRLGLPKYLSTSALLKVINSFADMPRYESIVKKMDSLGGGDGAVAGQLGED